MQGESLKDDYKPIVAYSMVDWYPKNLTKKLKKQEWHRKRDEAFARGEVLKPKK